MFQVYALQVGDGNSQLGEDLGIGEMTLSYNVGGIRISQAAFQRLQQEISLSPLNSPSQTGTPQARLNAAGFVGPWVDQQCEFFAGTVPLGNSGFRKLVIRKSRVARVDMQGLSILQWSEPYYYEVCANPGVYASLPGEQAARAKR
jgi:hypothetical protein